MPLLESPAGSGQNPVPPTRDVVAQFRVGASVLRPPLGSTIFARRSMRKLEEFKAKARELAQSSNFYGWPPLEFELRFEDGCSDAREWLYLPSTRDELDRICQAARKRREAA